MMQVNIKRCLSLMLALVLTFSLLPVSALAEDEAETIAIETTSTEETTSATEVTEAPTEPPEETTSEAEEIEPTIPETTVPLVIVEETAPVVAAASEDPEPSAAYQAVQAKMDEILETYKISKLTEEEVPEAVADMDEDTWFNALIEVEDLENSEEIQALTEEELLELTEKNSLFCAFIDAVYERAAATDDATIYARTVTVLDGQVSVTDSVGNGSVSSGTVTITAKGSLFSKKTNTVTVVNETTEQKQLSFDYSASVYNSFTIAGSAAAASGSYSAILAADASVTLVLTSNSGLSNATATLKLSNFSLTAVTESSNVTVNFDSSYGSVTAAGTAISSGEVLENITLEDGVELVATTKTGATFLGWVDASNNQRLSKDATYTIKPSADTIITAVFIGANSKPHFLVGAASQKSVSSGLLGLGKLYYHTVAGDYIFDDLNAAAKAAEASSTNKVVVLLNSATLPAGTYTIPAGVTLLIPFDANNSLYTTQPLNTGTYTSPTAYRTLTMENGTSLIINGVMSLSANQRYAAGGKPNGGSPTGPVSFVKMEDGSSITVNNGGTLYAYGYITGDGAVVAKSGAIVYEMFQFMDFRGGTQTTTMDNGVFPFSQYYVQNIEVPLTLYYGAKEYAYTTIYMSSADFGTAVAFIGASGAMFNLTSGYAVKKYDGTKDRLIIDIYGDTIISSITLEVSGTDINSKDYDLPINSNISIYLHTGAATINQDLALLPGSEVVIEQGASCTLGSTNNIYVYDSDEWGDFTFGENSVNSPFKALTYAPGRAYNRTNADLIDAAICVNGTVDASAGYIYTTAGGANIYSTGTGVITATPGTQTVTYQLVQGTGYTNIPITPAKLKNADGKYTETASNGTMTYEYARVDNADGEDVAGHWHTTFEVDGTRYRNFQIVSSNIKVNDGLDYYFWIYDSCPSQGGVYTAVVTKSFADGRDDVVQKYLHDLSSDSGTKWDAKTNGGIDYWRFAFSDISAKEMLDNISIKIYFGDQTADTADLANAKLISELNRTVQQYALETLAKYATSTATGAAEVRTALVDMLNYGADAQTHFNYNPENLVTAALTAEQQAQATEDNVECTNDATNNGSLKAVSVSAKNKLMLTFYFDFGGIDPTEKEYKAKITYTDGTNVYDDLEDGTFFPAQKTGYYGVDVEGVSMTKGRWPVTCTITDKDGNALGIGGTFSVQGYVALNADSTDTVYQSLMKFVDSACAYFKAIN